jgi:hypothetical protein
MAKHLPFNEFDLSGITNAVNRYKGAGLEPDYSLEGKAGGVVSIMMRNPMTRDGSLVGFEVHKLARPGWFGDKAWWVVQLYSKSAESETVEKRGCVTGKTQAHALTEAETDLRFNFMSICDFELASQGWDNRRPGS